MSNNAAVAEIEKIRIDLSEAQHQWNTLGKRLIRGYTEGYNLHKGALDTMKEQRREHYNGLYFLLSVVTAGFAGGLVGGLLAPLTRNVGESIALQTVAETIREVGKQTIVRGQIDTFERRYKNAPMGAYTPVSGDPQTFETELEDELGTCFSVLRDFVQTLTADAAATNADSAQGVRVYNILKASPLLRDAPGTNDLPGRDHVAREAEIGMWIAWANVRKIDYWNKHRDNLQDKHYDYRDWEAITKVFPTIEPLEQRLRTLDVFKHVSFHAPARPGFFTGGDYVNMEALKNLGAFLGGEIFPRVVKVIRDPQALLPELANIKPIWKRPQAAVAVPPPMCVVPTQGPVLRLR